MILDPKSPISFSIWLIQPNCRAISKRTWTGDWSDIDVILDSDDLETEHSEIRLFGKHVGLIYGCGSKVHNSNCGWRLRGDDFQYNPLGSPSNFSNLMITCVEKAWGLYDQDCPISLEELVSRLDWINHNSDFSEITYHFARLLDVREHK